jgi:hypothetical protein
VCGDLEHADGPARSHDDPARAAVGDRRHCGALRRVRDAQLTNGSVQPRRMAGTGRGKPLRRLRIAAGGASITVGDARRRGPTAMTVGNGRRRCAAGGGTR